MVSTPLIATDLDVSVIVENSEIHYVGRAETGATSITGPAIGG
jgi:hypothetical protein